MKVNGLMWQGCAVVLGLLASVSLADSDSYDFFDFLGDMVEVEDELVDAMTFESVESEAFEDTSIPSDGQDENEDTAVSDTAEAV
ncbi:MAG: hypothetical protein AAFN07_07525 [Pseudomonadota bacterium]